MGETQIYSQRLHGINEKRRIVDEVDRIQRELEQQKLKLHQLKRKSLRDRWLMEGLVPSPGAEIENPLSETEENIKKLEHELEGLQQALLYLENPDLKIANLKKQQESDPPKPLVNGDPSPQISDQKDLTPGRREDQNEHKVIEEEDIQPNGEEEKQDQVVDPSQNDPKPRKDVVVGHPVPAPRGKKVEKNHDQTSSDQKPDIVDQRNEEEHEKKTEDREVLNLSPSLEPQGDRSEHVGPNEELEDESSEQDFGCTDLNVWNQNSECLEKRLELEEEDMEHLTKRLEDRGVDLSAEHPIVDASQLSPTHEDARRDLDDRNNLVKVTVLEVLEDDPEDDSRKKPPVIKKHHEDQDSHDVEDKPVLVSVIQNQIEDIMVPVGSRDQSEDSALPRCQEEPANFMPVLISQNNDQNLESTSFPAQQSLVILSSDQQQSPKLPSKDPEPSVSLPSEVLVSQVQISQVVVISTPGHTSSGEPAQPSSDSQTPSTDQHKPATTEARAPAESQPLLPKPSETDGQPESPGTNTAETRDKNPSGKKKSCQCCVVM